MTVNCDSNYDQGLKDGDIEVHVDLGLNDAKQ